METSPSSEGTTPKVKVDQYDLDEIYLDRYVGQQPCPTCGVVLDDKLVSVLGKFMGERTHLEIHALTCQNCRKLVKMVGCNLTFLSKNLYSPQLHTPRIQGNSARASDGLDDDDGWDLSRVGY